MSPLLAAVTIDDDTLAVVGLVIGTLWTALVYLALHSINEEKRRNVRLSDEARQLRSQLDAEALDRERQRRAQRGDGDCPSSGH